MPRHCCYAMSAILSVYLISCVQPVGKPGSAGGDTAGGAGHWVHDVRLREVMAELDRVTGTNWPQELDRDPGGPGAARGPQWVEAANRSAALAEAAKRLPDAVSRLNLPEVDRRSFRAQAETLFDQATRVEKSTRGGDLGGMRTALAEIDATCKSCHTRFRDVSGPLERK